MPFVKCSKAGQEHAGKENHTDVLFILKIIINIPVSNTGIVVSGMIFLAGIV